MAGFYYTPFAVKIGIVCDSLLFDSLASAAEFVYISPNGNWRERLAAVDLFLVASTWHGRENNDWHGVAQENTPRRKLLYDMIEAARSAGKPVVFYSKEDPPNYEVFLEIAKRCDFVFTSAREMVRRYEEDCGHGRVEVLEFCIDPAVQNPIGCRGEPRNAGVVFSGSWMLKYPERCQDMAVLLDAAVDAGCALRIFDRNSNRSDMLRYRFPKRYRRYVLPAVEHSKLSEVHKRFDWSININSVTGSDTMFAARCYELLAEGCSVVSNYSKGMAEKFPEIALSYTAENTERIVSEPPSGTAFSRQASGIRTVMTGMTCYDRVYKILRVAGFDCPLIGRRVLVVADSQDRNVLKMFKNQTYSDRELVPPSKLSDDLISRYDFVSFWEPAHYYDPFYLEDMTNAFKWAHIDFATQSDAPYELIHGAPVLSESVLRTGCYKVAELLQPCGPTRTANGVTIPRRNEIFASNGIGSDTGGKRRVVVEVSIGRRWRHFRYRTFDSLARSRYFNDICILLKEVDRDDAVMGEAVALFCSKYSNISEETAAFPAELPRIEIDAGDEILPAGFDRLLEAMEVPGAGVVKADVLLCGNRRRLQEDGLTVVVASGKNTNSLGEIALVRHGTRDDSVGKPWMDIRIKPPSVFKRACICYNENGFWYTVRRIFFGKKSK